MSWPPQKPAPARHRVVPCSRAVEGQGLQRGPHGSAGAAITVFIFMVLGYRGSSASFQCTSASAHQLQQGFGCAQAGEKKSAAGGGLP